MSETTTLPPQSTTVSFQDFVPPVAPVRGAPAKSLLEAATTAPAAREAREQPAEDLALHHPVLKPGEAKNFVEKLTKFSKGEEDEPVTSDAKAPAAETAEAKQETPTAKKKLETGITTETTDAELDAHVAAKKNLNPEERQSFKHLTYETRQQKRDIAAATAEKTALETKLKELEAKLPTTDALAKLQSEIAAKQAKIDEQEMKLASTRYRETDKYITEIGEPMKRVEGFFDQIGAEGKITKAELMSIARMTGIAQDEALSDALVDLPDRTRQRIYGLMDEYTGLLAKDAELETKGKQQWDSFLNTHREAQERNQALAQGEYAKAVNETWENGIVKYAPFLKAGENKEWNEAVASAQKYAESADIATLSPKDKAEASHRVAVFPLMVRAVAELQKKLDAEMSRNSSIKAAKPSGASTIAGSTLSPEEKVEAGKGFLDKHKDFIARNGE